MRVNSACEKIRLKEDIPDFEFVIPASGEIIERPNANGFGDFMSNPIDGCGYTYSLTVDSDLLSIDKDSG
jgi:hypothetical protein